MANFDMTGVVQANSTVDIFRGVDAALVGAIGFSPIGYLTIVAIFIVILFRSLRSNEVAESVFTSSIVALLPALIFAYKGWVNVMVIFVIGVIGVMALVRMYKD